MSDCIVKKNIIILLITSTRHISSWQKSL